MTFDPSRGEPLHRVLEPQASEPQASAAQVPAGDVLSRRRFLGDVTAVTATASASAWAAGTCLAADPPAQAGAKPGGRKIKVGAIGCGGRGAWIAGLFKAHGGFEVHAVADYFPDIADRCGEALGVPKSRRFTGLSGYKKLLDSGVEAVTELNLPYFFPEQSHAALSAGCHVYMAKPIAVDVPGCLAIEAAGKLATKKNLCFLVDYQMPTDPINIEIAKRIWDGALGELFALTTLGGGGGSAVRAEPPKSKSIEPHLRDLIWCIDIPLGGDVIVNYDIHAIDAAIWLLRKRPVAAVGMSRFCRANPACDSRDLFFVTYECPDGVLWNHQSFNIPDHGKSLVVDIRGRAASAQLSYWGKSFLRGGSKHYGGGEVESLYDRGAVRNIAAFYNAIVQRKFDNPTVGRAVDGTLTAILGREAAARGVRLTMDELIKENKKLDVDLTGVKV